MSAKESASSSGVGFGSLLLLLFIGLKLGGVIDWSWWWVMSPVWLPLCGVVTLLAAGWLIYGALKAFKVV